MSDSDEESISNNGERKVIVAVRIRPKKAQGPERYDSACVKVDQSHIDFGLSQTGRLSAASEKSSPLFLPSNASPSATISSLPLPTVVISDPEGKTDALSFAFDRVFDETDDQDAVYQEIVHGPVLHALESGGDALFVAYGQTGSGKTYTMLGEDARYVSTPSSTSPQSLGATLRGKSEQAFTTTPRKAGLGGTLYFSDFADTDDTTKLVLDPGAGVLMRVMNTVLQYKEQRVGADKQWHVVIAMSAVEVYNDSLFDLLAENGGAKANIRTGPNARNVELDVREFGDDLFITNLQRFVITKTSHVQAVFEIALKNRSVAPTQMNDTSSRSHAIFTTEVFLQRRTAGNPDPPDPAMMAEHLIMAPYQGGGMRLGRTSTSSPASNPLSSNPSNDFNLYPITGSRITMVDLAGNERVKKSGVSGKELSEAVAVNKSLSALGHVVHQICQGAKHINFRDSKVTRLLRSAFANPKSRIAFITNVSPIGLSYPESVCSLRFAARLKELKPVAQTATNLQAQTASAQKEDQMLQRLNVFEQLCADFRILQTGWNYRPQANRWRKISGNNKMQVKTIANKYGEAVKETQEMERVLEIEQLVQQFTSEMRGPQVEMEGTAQQSFTEAEMLANEKVVALRKEIQALTALNEEQVNAIEKIQQDINKAQELTNAANRLLGAKSDAQRAVLQAQKEEEALEAQIALLTDPNSSALALATSELNLELAGKERDEIINQSNEQFATKLLAHNASKIAVRSERIAQLAIRNEIDATQNQILSLFSASAIKRVRVPIASLAASDDMDMSKILSLCSTVRNPVSSAPLREDQQMDGAVALEQCMTRRLKSSLALSLPYVSPIAYYVSPTASHQLSKYMSQVQSDLARNTPSNYSNYDSDDSASTLLGDQHSPREAIPVLFEGLTEAKKEELLGALQLFVVHGKVMALLDNIHVTRLVDNRKIKELFSILDHVPMDLVATDCIVGCAKRQDGSDADDPSEWSGDELESNMGSSASVYRADRTTNNKVEGRGAKSPTISDQTKRVLKRLIDNPALPPHAALIRCIQAHSLFGRIDAYCDASSDGAQYTINRVIKEVRRRSLLRRLLDVKCTPAIAPREPRTSSASLPSTQILSNDTLAQFVQERLVNDPSAVDSATAIDEHLSYLSPFASAMPSSLLQKGAGVGTHRDLSPIAFYGCRIIDSTSLMMASGAENADTIPHMPSTVRFAEMLLMCCGYGR